MDQYQRYLADEQAKRAAMTQAATGAGASALAASTLAGFNWPGLVKRATPNIMGPLGVLAGMAMPGKLNNPQVDPRYRQNLHEEARTGVHGMPQREMFNATATPIDSIAAHMKRNAGYLY